MLAALLFCIAFGVLNRARGSKLFEKTNSTSVARLVSTLGMAVLTMLMADPERSDLKVLLLWTWASLYLWSVPGWGKYAGTAIGYPLKDETEFAPVDWVMAKLPIKNTRLWGTVAMCLRMTLAIPCVVGVAFLTDGSCWWSLATPMMGWAYYLCGYAFRNHQWMYSEYCAGAIFGVIIFMTSL